MIKLLSSRNTMDSLGITPGRRNENDLVSLKIRADEEGISGGFRIFQLPDSAARKEFTLGNA